MGIYLSRKTLGWALLLGLLAGTGLAEPGRVAAVPGDGEALRGGTVVLSALTRPATLHPLMAQDTVSTLITKLLFAALVRLNERAEPEPSLAESWTVSRDGKVWTFFLRKGVKFHDGAELTARDVAYTYAAARDPRTEYPRAPLYRPIERLEAPGRYVFQVTLKEPYAPLLNLLDLEILPAHLLETGKVSAGEFDRRPVGAGPFRLARWEGDEVTLEAFPDYYAGRPRLERVVVRTFPNRLSSWTALMRGEVDAVEDLDFADYREIKDDPRFQVLESFINFYYTLLFNLEDPLFRDPRMRRALSLAVDRGDLVAQALDGWGVPASGPFLPGTWPCDESVPADPYRPEEAAALLRALGWHDADGDRILEKEGRELAFSLLVDRGDSLKEKAARRLRWQLYQVGARVDIEVMDLDAMFGERLLPGRFQAALLQFNGYRDPDFWARSFWHSENVGRNNLARYRSPEVDELFRRGRAESDFGRRKGIYRRLHRVLAADRPALFLFFRKQFAGFSARIAGVRAAPLVFYRSVPDWYVREP